MTTITLPKDVEEWARQEVAAGRAKSVEDLVAETMRERQSYDWHKPLVLEAYEQMARGEFLEEEEVDALVDGWIKEDEAKSR